MNKRDRQQKILSLIQAKPIGTQEDLRSLLEKTGVPATQSSVSAISRSWASSNIMAITRYLAQMEPPFAGC